MDESALDRLYVDHAHALIGYVTRLTGDPQLAEDLTQETLLRAWTHPGALPQGASGERAWLLTVSRNLVRDHARARKARPQEAGPERIESRAGEAGEDDIDHALLSWVVADALRSLSPDHRAVLLETFYRGLSVRQAADALEVPAGTVKSRTYYALRALKVALEERGVRS